MWIYSFTIATILLGSPILPTTGNDLNLNLCTNNETIAIQLSTSASAVGRTCQCQASASHDPEFRDGYVHTPGVGTYKLHTNPMTWNDARKICDEEGGHLAIINSKTEEKVLLDMFRKSQNSIIGSWTNEEALVGLHDLFNEGDWLSIFSEPIQKTGYSEWTTVYGQQEPDNSEGNQNCAALHIRGRLDDVRCSYKHAFFCELPVAC